MSAKVNGKPSVIEFTASPSYYKDGNSGHIAQFSSRLVSGCYMWVANRSRTFADMLISVTFRVTDLDLELYSSQAIVTSVVLMITYTLKSSWNVLLEFIHMYFE